jgi:hypothetical protein
VPDDKIVETFVVMDSSFYEGDKCPYQMSLKDSNGNRFTVPITNFPGDPTVKMTDERAKEVVDVARLHQATTASHSLNPVVAIAVCRYRKCKTEDQSPGADFELLSFLSARNLLDLALRDHQMTSSVPQDQG